MLLLINICGILHKRKKQLVIASDSEAISIQIAAAKGAAQ